MSIDSVVSRDGTSIGFERLGDGPPLVVLHGATADHTRWAPVAGMLAEQFTVYLVDRRGRGLSGDRSGPYDIAREAADLTAVADAAGERGSVALLAHSYGALVALTALAEGARFRRVLLYEPPFRTPGHEVFPSGLLDRMADQLAAEDREGALRSFFRGALELDDEVIDAMRPTAVWRARVAAAHTVEREGRRSTGSPRALCRPG